MFPPSVTVRVTVFGPISAQVNDETSILNVGETQLSVEPLFTSDAVIVTLPVASKYAVIFCATAIGEVVSLTVTIAVAVEVLLLPSVAVSVTVLTPISEQSKVVLSKLNVNVEQLSKLPLSISPATIVAVPDASSTTLKFWAIAIGANESITVTIAVAVEMFPFPSSAVNITLFVPTSLQSKKEVSTDKVTAEQLSVVPLSN